MFKSELKIFNQYLLNGLYNKILKVFKKAYCFFMLKKKNNKYLIRKLHLQLFFKISQFNAYTESTIPDKTCVSQ